jgi:hypothetical protein
MASGLGSGGDTASLRNPLSVAGSFAWRAREWGSRYQRRYQVGVSPAFRRIASGHRPEPSPSTSSPIAVKRSSRLARAGSVCGESDGDVTPGSGCRDAHSSAARRTNSERHSPRSLAARSQRFRAAGLARTRISGFPSPRVQCVATRGQPKRRPALGSGRLAVGRKRGHLAMLRSERPAYSVEALPVAPLDSGCEAVEDRRASDREEKPHG